MKFVPFYFDGNQWFGLVDGVEKWRDLLMTYSDVDQVLNAKMAPGMEIDELPKEYFLGNPTVTEPDLLGRRTPSFGFRREHKPGTVRLEDWAKSRGMNLRTMAETRPRA